MDPVTATLAANVMSVLMPYAAMGAQEFVKSAGKEAYEKAKSLPKPPEPKPPEPKPPDTNTDESSSQTVSAQLVGNTGNAQNTTSIIQVGGKTDDFEFDDVGSSIEVSPSSTTDSVQQVDQSTSASD